MSGLTNRNIAVIGVDMTKRRGRRGVGNSPLTESKSGLREQLGGLAKDGLLKVASEPEG